MKVLSIIGVDLAKDLFQLLGASADGAVVFRKKLSRSQMLKLLASHPDALLRRKLVPVPIIGAERLANWVMMFV